MKDNSAVTELESVHKTEYVYIPDDATYEPVRWRCHYKVEKRLGDDPDTVPYEIVEGDGNLLVTAGATALWTALTGASITHYYDGTNSNLGVGDSSTATTISMTDLQAATNKVRKVVDSSPVVSTNTITFVATFTTSDGNFAWQEWAVFNFATTNTMLNRKVVSLGTKTNSAAWTLTVTLSLA